MADLALAGPRPGSSEFRALFDPLAARMRELELCMSCIDGAVAASRVDDLDYEMVLETIRELVASGPAASPDEQARRVSSLITSVAVGPDETRVDIYAVGETKAAGGGSGGSYKGLLWRTCLDSNQ